MQLVIENGADVNLMDNGFRSPLLLASSHRNEDVVRILLEKGANVNARNIYGWTPFLAASDPEITQLLIDRGVDCNARDVERVRPSSKACQKSLAKVAHVLLAGDGEHSQ